MVRTQTNGSRIARSIPTSLKTKISDDQQTSMEVRAGISDSDTESPLRPTCHSPHWFE